jgi:hypothetical protein
MDLLKNSKILAALVLVAVLALGYFAYSSLTSPAPATVTQTSPVSQNLLLALSNLHTIRLNGSIFSDPAFQSLSDFGVVIPPEPAGRRNPFQPIGGSVGTTGTTGTTR